MPSTTTQTAKPGFSLIELLVVIAIIAIVIAIIVPALGGARTAARKAATSALLTDVSSAAEQFSQDNAGRMPGYFLPSEMGSPGNDDGFKGGFTTMENALLDLIGQDAIVGTAGISGGGGAYGKLIGPFGNAGNAGKGGNANLRVDLNLLGTGDSVYLEIGEDNLKAAEGQAASTPHQQFPDLVDAFGNPVLAWVEDPAAPREPLNEDEFATEHSRQSRARYYWASNSGWLASTGLGKGGQDQTLDVQNRKYGSLLNDKRYAAEVLTAVLGNPNFPMPTDYGPATVLPSASRGAFLVHSAGPDGIYFGAKDSGARSIGVDGDTRRLEYAFNFFPDGKNGSANVRWKDSDGKPAPIDLTKGFDDIITGTGN